MTVTDCPIFNCWPLRKLATAFLASIAISSVLGGVDNSMNSTVKERSTSTDAPANVQPPPTTTSDAPDAKTSVPNAQSPAEKTPNEPQEQSDQDTSTDPQAPPKNLVRDEKQRERGDPRPKPAVKPKKSQPPKTIRMRVWRKGQVTKES